MNGLVDAAELPCGAMDPVMELYETLYQGLLHPEWVLFASVPNTTRKEHFTVSSHISLTGVAAQLIAPESAWARSIGPY